MDLTLSRRTLLKGVLAAALAVPSVAPWADRSLAAAVALDPNDPSAKALAFVSDYKQVDAAANPTFKPTQKCGNCAQYQAKTGDATGPCAIFPGKTVPSAGWCRVWAQKAAAS